MNVITSDESPEKNFHSTAQINQQTNKPTKTTTTTTSRGVQIVKKT